MHYWLAFVLLLAINSRGYCQFEGVIVLMVSMNNGDTSESSLYRLTVRNDLMLSELSDSHGLPENSRGSFIYRGDSHTLWILDKTGKSCTEIRLHDDTTSLPHRSTGSSSTLTTTGNKSTICSYPCDEFVVTEDGRTSIIQATDRIGPVYGGLSAALSSGEPDWSLELALRNYFPLRIVTTSGSRVVESLEVNTISPGHVPETSFDIPAGFTKQTVDIDMEKILQKIGTRDTRTLGTADSAGRH